MMRSKMEKSVLRCGIDNLIQGTKLTVEYLN